MFIDNLTSPIPKFSLRFSHLLCCAAKHGHFDVVKYLIAQGIPTGPGCNLWWQALLKDAALEGHLPMFKYLLDETTSKDLPQVSATELLYRATSGCHLDLVKYLVKCGADFINPPSRYIPKNKPGSIFDFVIDSGHEDIASFFLHSAPPELQNNIRISGWYSMLRPCLHDEVPYPCTSPWGKPHIAQMILDRIDLEIQLTTTTALEQAHLFAVAAETGNVALTQRLLDKGC
ncbi:unnamed protein product [Penicillium nalgiovense]|uniref:Uncharacterized protein n=1 Tax=Penicillium nalgiovense TaxID=60175 RepID=A0A9W4MWC1_PENNA|nr:unnamed protein product [Penicillium nalgiovense]CAG8066753.1 unnamed protein product [Penicillium nalgiovense]CAG8084390.1 unnamed protein product [Penicillium nalgiovense]CAG8147878.1 unnamed protein product [Penicillium nalgiovense]CAG8154252.1 unnamed protein product [Penicillium nalgiovense]